MARPHAARALAAAGHQVTLVEVLDKVATRSAAYRSLRAMGGTAFPELLDEQISRWSRDPFAQGAHSFNAVGPSAATRKTLDGAHWDGRPIFLGEPSCAGDLYPPTVPRGASASCGISASLGIAVARLRLPVFGVEALISSVVVAFSGPMGFVRLMMPHHFRLLARGDKARALPLSALFGAVSLVLADTLARVVMAPRDMPTGVVTGLIAGVCVLWLMVRRS